MSMLDRATMFHQAVRMNDHTPETFKRLFFNHWVNFAGAPHEVSVDLERGLCSQAFADALGSAGIHVMPIAGQAHWQHGKIERHGSTLKDMIAKVVTQGGAKGPDEMAWVAAEASSAKNTLVREHGFSPSQLVFGREPKLYGELFENGEPCAMHFEVGERGTQVARFMRYRQQSRQAYIQIQANNMLQRTVRNRTRPWKDPQIGDRCFFYREARKKGVTGVVKGWHGPALVVGAQGQSSLWVVFGGKCFLVAQEHCREAVGEEKLFGRPEVQEALSVFQKRGRTYEDLRFPAAPPGHDLDCVPEMSVDSDEESAEGEVPPAPVDPKDARKLPDKLRSLVRARGWKLDKFGNPVQVSFGSFAFKVPMPKYPGENYPIRSTWARWDGNWYLIENEVCWSHLDDSVGLLPGGQAEILLTIFKPRTRRQICLDSVPACVKKARVGESISEGVARVFTTLSRRKAQKALDKEIPF